MPINMFAPAAPQPAPADPNKLAALSVGAQRSQMLAELLAKNAYGQERLPGSDMEGISRMFNAGVAGYQMNQADSQEQERRKALISALGGDADPLSVALVADGDKEGINSVVQSHIADKRLAAERAYQEQQTKTANERADKVHAGDQAFTHGENEANRAAAASGIDERAKNALELEMEKFRLKNGEGGKPLTNPETKLIAPLGDNLAMADNYVSTFRPEYGNHYFGATAQMAGRTTGLNMLPGAMSEDASNFWTEYQESKNVARHNLFGSALTASEKPEWDKSDITPNMPDTQITWNLQRRAVLARRAALKMGRNALAGGKNAQQVMNLTGLSLEELQGTDLPPIPAPWTTPKGDDKAAPQNPRGAPTAAPTGAPAAAAPQAAVTKQLPDGRTAYQDPKTGKWFDNPQFQ